MWREATKHDPLYPYEHPHDRRVRKAQDIAGAVLILAVLGLQVWIFVRNFVL